MIPYLEKTLGLLAALDHPGAIREFFVSKAFSAPCFRLNQALKSHQSHFGTILDVGANVGQFALAAALHFPDAEIFSFEPLPDVFQELRENTRRRPRIRSLNCALGNQNGHIPLHRNEYSRLSSALRINAANDHPRYRERKTSIINVEVFRLDEFHQVLEIKHPLLLKMDVQGMEMEVLLGTGDFLNQVDFILCEVALTPLYDNQPLFDEIHAFIQHRGYSLVAPLYLNRGKGGKIIEMDVLYARRF
jgi:FkbM family methyltransferase